MTLAERYLNRVTEKSNLKLKVFLINGYQLNGSFDDGDMSGITIYAEEYEKLVFIPMTAISTIVSMG